MHDRPIRYGSVCSGVGTCALAWHPIGWRSAFFAEIDRFASAVLKHHWPDVPNVGDFTKMPREGWDIDVLAGGTPCQAFSMAGLRKGLNDDRGNLTLEFVRLADGIHAAQPGGLPVVVWENVPGVLTDRTNAFGCFLGALCGEDDAIVPPDGVEPKRWRALADGSRVFSWPDAGVVLGPAREVAWRVLDAQYFGLAQRRRRVVVVACARGSGLCAAEVLAEFDGVRRDLAPSRQEGQDAAETLTASAQSRGWRGSVDDAAGGQLVAGALGAGDGGADDNDAAGGRLIPQAFGGNNTEPIEVSTTCNAKGGTGRMDFESETFVVNAPQCQNGEISHPLTTKCGMVTENCMGNGNGAPLIPVQEFGAIPINEVGKRTGGAADTKEGTGIGRDGDPAFTLGTDSRQGVAQPADVVAYDPCQVTSATNRSNPQPGDPCHTLPARPEAPMVVFGSKGDGGDAGEVAPTMRAAPHDTSHQNAGCPPAVAHDLSWQGGSAQDQIVGPGAVSPTLAHSSCANGGHNEPKVLTGLTVRRLTPRECERLQGYPDDHTLVPHPSRLSERDTAQLVAYWGVALIGRKLGIADPDHVRPSAASRLAADGPRYRAIGNGWARDVFAWVGRRVDAGLRARP